MDITKIIVLSTIYIMMLVISIMYFVKRVKNKMETPAHNGFFVSMMLYYLVIPILVLFNISDLNQIENSAGRYGSATFQRFIIEGEWFNFIYAIVMIIIAFAAFIFFYERNSRKNKNLDLEFDKENTYFWMKLLMYTTFGIGIVSLIIFFASFGGISKALSYAEEMRKMSSSTVELVGNAALLKIIARLITVTPFLAIYLINEKKEEKKKILTYKIIFGISMLASTLYYLYNAGRAPILLFALCFVYGIFALKIKKTWTVLIILGVICLPVLDLLDSLFVFLNTGEFNLKEVNYAKYIYQFSTPYKNTLILTDLIDSYGLRWGKDFITAIIDLLPGVSFEPAYVDLSQFVRGDNWRNLGGIPADFITFAYMEFSFVGVFAFSAIMGYVTQIIDLKLSLFQNKVIKKFFGGILTIFFFSSLTSFDVASIIRGQFILLFIVFIVLKSSKKKNKVILNKSNIERKNKMNLLFISSSPLEYSASSNMRNIALLNGFIKKGYRIHTLTPRPQEDSKLYDKTICDIKIKKQYFIEMGAIRSKVTLKKNQKNTLKKLIYKMVSSFKIYDFRSDLAKKDIRIKEKFDLIISSSDPKSSHLIAENLIKNNPGITKKWIQYWGDPFANDINQKGLVPKFIVKREEERVLKLADKIVYVSPFTLEKQKENYPSCAQKMIFLPIPYKEKIFYADDKNETLTLGYFGDYIASNRNILPLYNTIKDNQNVNLIICGNSDITLEKLDNIQIKGRVPLSEVRQLEENSDVLVCVCNKSGTQIPGKIYHYAATNKPILVIVDGEYSENIKNYLKSFNRFILCDNNEESILQCINDEIKQNKKFSPCEEMYATTIVEKLLDNI